MEPEVIENSDSSMETTENLDSSTEDAPTQEEGESKQEFTDRERQYYARIKALEQQLKERTEKKIEPSPDTSLSNQDLLYLAKADIAEDDLDEVVTYARKMGVSVKQAHAFYKPILNERAEERRTAQVTETRSPRGTAKSTGSDLLQKAETTGDLPDTEAGLNALIKARLEAKRKR